MAHLETRSISLNPAETPLGRAIATVNYSQLALMTNPQRDIRVYDLTSETQKQGQSYTLLPNELAAHLPGSALNPESFLRLLGEKKDTSLNTLSRTLISDKVRQIHDSPLYAFKESTETSSFALNVSHGSFNKYAMKMTEIAATRDTTDHEGRKEYQTALHKVMLPVLNGGTKDYSLRIIEDCGASAETILATINTLAKETKINTKGTIRIDLAVATAQSVLILQEFAKQNNLKLEVNVGQLAYGLSSGENIPHPSGEGHFAVKKHANYLTVPENILRNLPKAIRENLQRFKGSDGNIYVVGDMGDWGKSLPDTFDTTCPWNKYRGEDTHGERLPNQTQTIFTDFSEERRTIVGLANGGYLGIAMAKNILGENFGHKDMSNVVIFSAKRLAISDEERDGNYAVLIYGIEGNIYNKN